MREEGEDLGKEETAITEGRGLKMFMKLAVIMGRNDLPWTCGGLL